MALSTQSRAPGNPRVSSIMRHDQRDLRGAGIHAPTRKAVLDFVEERFQHRRHATAHHQNVGIEKVYDIAEPRYQDFDGLKKNLASCRIAAGQSLPHELAGNG